MDNKIAYHHFLKNHNLPIFFQDWWLDATAGSGNWEVLLNFDKNEAITAIWAFSISKRWGNKIITNPILTPFLGVWLNYPKDISVAKKVDFEEHELEKLISKLPKVAFIQCGFDVKFTNWQPFYWAGFEQTTYYSYIFEETNDLNNIQKNFKSNLRNHIQKAFKELEIVESEDVQTLFNLVNSTFQRQNKSNPISFEMLNTIYTEANKRQSSKIFFAKNADNQIVGGTLYVYDQQTVYNLISGISKDNIHSGAISLLLWKGIQHANEQHLAFNFEGSMIKNVNQIYSSFGAKQVPYFLIRKSNNKWVETARIWLKKRL